MKNYLRLLVYHAFCVIVANAQQGWVAQTSPLGSDPLGQIQFVSPTEGWIAGDNGALAKTTTGGVTSVRKDRDMFVPNQFTLEQNYPNPFNPSTTIHYELPTKCPVVLKVFDVLSREVATLVNGEQTVGYKSVTWNAANVPSGIYFYRLQAGAFVETKKLLLLK